MLTCRQYIFELTSGRLAEATGMARFWGTQHRLVCHRCRAFTRNDQQLDNILAGYRDHLQRPPGKDEHD